MFFRFLRQKRDPLTKHSDFRGQNAVFMAFMVSFSAIFPVLDQLILAVYAIHPASSRVIPFFYLYIYYYNRPTTGSKLPGKAYYIVNTARITKSAASMLLYKEYAQLYIASRAHPMPAWSPNHLIPQRKYNLRSAQPGAQSNVRGTSLVLEKCILEINGDQDVFTEPEHLLKKHHAKHDTAKHSIV